MSLVGNFTQNYDRSSQQGGAGLQRTNSNASYHPEEPIRTSPIRHKSSLPTINQGEKSYPSNDGSLYPSGASDQDQSSTPMSMTDTLHSRTQNVTDLARNMSRRSETQGNLFDYAEGSDLDPFSDNFNAQKWTRQLAAMRSEGAPGRQAGVAFKNMSVHGFGSDAGASLSVLRKSSSLTIRLPENYLELPSISRRLYSRQDLRKEAQGSNSERHRWCP